MGVGVRPYTKLAEQAGIELGHTMGCLPWEWAEWWAEESFPCWAFPWLWPVTPLPCSFAGTLREQVAGTHYRPRAVRISSALLYASTSNTME